jgi:phosphonate transport system permease protein
VTIREFVKGLPGMFDYIRETLPVIRPAHAGADIASWYGRGWIWLKAIFDTILIALLATFFATLAAFIMCFPASRNLVESYPIYFACRRLMEIARGVPELVYALVFVPAFGLGPIPGVLAIGIHGAGSLCKLFSEVNENIDTSQIEGTRATGANWLQMIRYSVVPQVAPNFMSYALLRMEINVRAATVIGFVGAGGIGMELMFAIRQFQYTDISAMVLMIFVCVFALDYLCENLRHRIIGKEQLL